MNQEENITSKDQETIIEIENIPFQKSTTWHDLPKVIKKEIFNKLKDEFESLGDSQSIFKKNTLNSLLSIRKVSKQCYQLIEDLDINVNQSLTSDNESRELANIKTSIEKNNKIWAFTSFGTQITAQLAFLIVSWVYNNINNFDLPLVVNCLNVCGDRSKYPIDPSNILFIPGNWTVFNCSHDRSSANGCISTLPITGMNNTDCFTSYWNGYDPPTAYTSDHQASGIISGGANIPLILIYPFIALWETIILYSRDQHHDYLKPNYSPTNYAVEKLGKLNSLQKKS